MKKIKTVFVIDRENGNLATPVIVESSSWVINGEGFATVKFDGTSTMWKDGKLWKRFDRKVNKGFQKFVGTDMLDVSMFKDAPEGFIPCEEFPDKNTGHWPGWVPITEHDVWHIEGLKNTNPDILEDGATFELIGPRVQSNPQNVEQHVLVRHGSVIEEVPDRSFDGIRNWLADHVVEGLVFHHPDGRMAKIRRKDFGIPWNKK